jgi:hypothetical protein
MAFYWILIAGVFLLLLRQIIDIDRARIIAMISALATVLVGLGVYVKFVSRRFSRFRLLLTDNSLTVCAQTPGWFGGLLEKEYFLADLDSVILGQELNLVDDASTLLRDLKQGRLIIRTRSGTEDTFEFLDKAFDEGALAAMFAEISKRDAASGLTKDSARTSI